MNDFISLNNAKAVYENNKITVSALPKTDYFVNPETNECKANAQFLYKTIKCDFVIEAKVSHDFVSTYDACVLFAFDNEKKWAKACFEYSDFGTYTVVSVMTNGVSDDANGVNIDNKYVWLRLSRKGNVFAVHYSLDGSSFIMARLAHINMNEEIKVGIVAQSPIGNGGERVFENLSIVNKTLDNIRLGK